MRIRPTFLSLLLCTGILLSGCSLALRDVSGDETPAPPSAADTDGTAQEETLPAGQERQEQTDVTSAIDGDSGTAGTPPETASAEPAVRVFPLGIYLYEDGVYRRQTEYRCHFPTDDADPAWILDTWTVPGETHRICDTAYFTVLPWDDDCVSMAGYDTDWVARWSAAGLDNYKIGFRCTAKEKDGTCHTIYVRSPADTFGLETFLEIYLYDDIAHAGDSWYSHVTEDEVQADIVYTTLKITLRDGCYRLDSIELTAFVYTEEEWDGTRYTGANTVSMLCRPAV